MKNLLLTTAMIFAATPALATQTASTVTDTGRNIYFGMQIGMGELSMGDFQDDIVTKSTQDMYDGLRAKGHHDLRGWEGNFMFPEPLHWKAPKADVSMFGRSTLSEGTGGSNGRVFVGTRLGDKLGVELGMFKTKSRSTTQHFDTNGLVNLKRDLGFTDPNWIIWAIEGGAIDPQGAYACVVGYESIENFGCSGTTKVTTAAKGIDLVGSYDLFPVLSLRGGIHKSTVTSTVTQYSSASVNPSHWDYNDPEGHHKLSNEIHTGFGPVIGVRFEYKGFTTDLTRHHKLGGVDVHSNTISLGYKHSF